MKFRIAYSTIILSALLFYGCTMPPMITPEAATPASPDAPVSSPTETVAAPVETPAETPAETPTPEGGAFSIQEAPVDRIEIRTLESMPVQIHVVAYGNLPTGCAVIHDWEVSQEGNDYTVRLNMAQPIDAICTQALVPYEQVIPLDVVGLSAGTYNVTVNGVSGTFELSVDNASVPQLPVAQPPDPETQSYLDLAVQSLATHLDVEVDQIEVESLTIPADGTDDPYVIRLLADGTTYEYHGKYGSVVLAEPS
jgi:hypothetical protein